MVATFLFVVAENGKKGVVLIGRRRTTLETFCNLLYVSYDICERVEGFFFIVFFSFILKVFGGSLLLLDCTFKVTPTSLSFKFYCIHSFHFNGAWIRV